MTAASATAARPSPPSRARRNASLVAVAILLAWALLTLQYDPGKILELPGGIGHVFYKMYLEDGPDWSYLPTSLQKMLESLEMAWIGTVIGAAISLPLGFFGAKNISSGLVSNALAMGLHSVGTLGKLTAEVVEGIDPGPVEAARATGASPLQVQRWGVLPQVMPEIIAFWLYRFEINIRASAVLGVVGAGGIGFLVQQTIVFNRFRLTGTALIVVIGITIVVDTISGWLRRRIIEGAEAKVRGEFVEQPELVPG
jgi:phosphonate transport system permease protein